MFCGGESCLKLQNRKYQCRLIKIGNSEKKSLLQEKVNWWGRRDMEWEALLFSITGLVELFVSLNQEDI